MPLSGSTPIDQIVRPPVGWLRAVRNSLDLTLAEMAQRLKVTPPAVRSFEQAEAEDRITLASLRRVAAAMDCELVYALVPRSDNPLPLPDAKRTKHDAENFEAKRLPATRDDENAAKKVTDLTWRTLHGGS